MKDPFKTIERLAFEKQELLAALEKIVEEGWCSDKPHRAALLDVERIAEAAIAKAKGGE